MNQKDAIFFSIILIIAAVIIAGAIVFYRNEIARSTGGETTIVEEFAISPITADDHILGNPDADVIWVEYSDFKCPYCREFHPIIRGATADFGRDGRLAWVYRHFPAESAISGEDSISKTAAIASECVADIGGEIKFWSFISGIFEKLPITFSVQDLEVLVTELEIDIYEYRACLISGKFDEKIQRNINDGLEIFKYDRQFATPYNIIIPKSGQQLQYPGVESYAVIREIVNMFSFPKSLRQ